MKHVTVALVAAVVLGGVWSDVVGGENLLSNASFEELKESGTPTGWRLVKNDKDKEVPGKATFELAKVPPPPGSTIGKSKDAPETISALSYSIDEGLTWAYVCQTIRDAKIVAGRTYRFGAWLKSDKPAQVMVIMDMMGEAGEEGGKVPSQNKWTAYEVTPKWRFCTSEVTVNDEATYNRLWPRAQLYTAGAEVIFALPELVEVEE